MDKFKNAMKLRLAFIGGFAVLYIIANCLMYIYVGVKGGERISSFIEGFQLGVGIAVLALLIFFMIEFASAIRNENRLKKMYVMENDERTIMIRQKSGSAAINIAAFGLAGAAVLAGYFNAVVFFSLLGASVFVSLVHGALKLYYHFKY